MRLTITIVLSLLILGFAATFTFESSRAETLSQRAGVLIRQRMDETDQEKAAQIDRELDEIKTELDNFLLVTSPLHEER